MSDIDIPFNATEDLSGTTSGTGHIFKAVDIDGTIAANSTAIGLLQNGPKNGEDGAARAVGRSNYVAGAAVTAGARLMITTSGYAITCTSGSGVVGRALSTVVSGGVSEGVFNFATPGVIIA